MEDTTHSDDDECLRTLANIESRVTWTVNITKGSVALYTRGSCPCRTPIGLTVVAEAAAEDLTVDEETWLIEDIVTLHKPTVGV